MKISTLDKPLQVPSIHINRQRLAISLFLALAIGIYIRIAPTIWQRAGIDLYLTFVPAARALVSGQNPYIAEPSFFNPAWILIPFIPLVYLPREVSTVIFFILSLGIYIGVGLKLKAKPIALIAFLLSPVVVSLRQANIEPLVLLGFILPAPIGLFFVITKPQLGIGIAIYWLIEAWQSGGLRKVIKTFTPITLALAATFLIYGNWLAYSAGASLTTAWWNYSLFPWGIPAGIILLGASFIYHKKQLAGAASPLFSPYVPLYSWHMALVGFFDNDLLMVVSVLIMWILVTIHG